MNLPRTEAFEGRVSRSKWFLTRKKLNFAYKARCKQKAWDERAVLKIKIFLFHCAFLKGFISTAVVFCVFVICALSFTVKYFLGTCLSLKANKLLGQKWFVHKNFVFISRRKKFACKKRLFMCNPCVKPLFFAIQTAVGKLEFRAMKKLKRCSLIARVSLY